MPENFSLFFVSLFSIKNLAEPFDKTLALWEPITIDDYIPCNSTPIHNIQCLVGKGISIRVKLSEYMFKCDVFLTEPCLQKLKIMKLKFYIKKMEFLYGIKCFCGNRTLFLSIIEKQETIRINNSSQIDQLWAIILTSIFTVQ